MWIWPLTYSLGGGCLAHMPRAISNGNIEVKYISDVLNVIGQYVWHVWTVPTDM